MGSHSITRRFTFDAGHRVLNHESKCRHLHGHTYLVELTVSSAELDELGRVIDFGCLKEIVGGWIDRELDHNLILHPDDPLAEILFDDEELHGRASFIMPGSGNWANPTAENLARLIFNQSLILLTEKGLKVEKVRLYETQNCYAEYNGS